MVKRLVLSNSGNDTDAHDVFQDGLVVLFEKLKTAEQPFEINCAGYIKTVCKNLWLMKIRRKKVGIQKEQDITLGTGDLNDEILEDMMQTQRYELYRNHFKRLGADCQKVLTLFLQKVPMKKIAETMGFSEMYAKKRKYKCQKSLISSIEKDHLYKELITV